MPADPPAFLKPRLLLFLSVDLVGSTAIKQSSRFALVTPDESRSPTDQFAPWIKILAGFFAATERMFSTNWRSYFSAQPGDPDGDQYRPRIWKINGDELIYVGYFDEPRSLIKAICIWARTIKDLRDPVGKLSAELGLDIKATAWTAGTPISNMEIMPAGLMMKDEDTSGGIESYQIFSSYRQLDAYYGNNGIGDARASDRPDYLGPGVDAGFRLAAHSTPRKFVISIDIAYILSHMHSNLFKVIAREIGVTSDFRYDGTISLKGVNGGKAYPIFWLDTFDIKRASVIEDSLTRDMIVMHDRVFDFCEAFYSENSRYLYHPFMCRSNGDVTFGVMPDSYRLHLSQLQTWYRQECQRQEQVQGAVHGDSAPKDAEDPEERAEPLEQLEEFAQNIARHREIAPSDEDS